MKDMKGLKVKQWWGQAFLIVVIGYNSNALARAWRAWLSP